MTSLPNAAGDGSEKMHTDEPEKPWRIADQDWGAPAKEPAKPLEW